MSSYSISEQDAQKLAKNLQKLTLEQTVTFNKMGDASSTYQAPRLYVETLHMPNKTLEHEEVCQLFWVLNRVYHAGGLWYINDIIGQLEQGYNVRVGVPPPPPPPPPPDGN